MNKQGPLEGVTVIDLSRVLAGPYASMVLADLGARVVKIEIPDYGDDARHFGPFINGKSAYFMSLNRGKESIALNLKDESDREIFENMLSKADILVENYRPGTMEKLGYSWDALHKKFPHLIYSAISGFGHSGPYSKRAAYDMVVQGMGGIMSVTGHPGGEPTRVGTSVGDITAGLFGVTGILAALYDRQSTGKGAMVDVGMLDCQVAILENAIARYFAADEIPGPIGARHPSITPFEAYSCADGHIIVAAGNDILFAKLSDALKIPEMKVDPDFASNDLRTQNHEKLKDCIEESLTKHSLDYWLAKLDEAGVPSGPINNVKQVLEDAHVASRNMVISTDDPVAGSVNMAGNPIKLSNYPDPSKRVAAPELDGDREAILAGF